MTGAMAFSRGPLPPTVGQQGGRQGNIYSNLTFFILPASASHWPKPAESCRQGSLLIHISLHKSTSQGNEQEIEDSRIFHCKDFWKNVTSCLHVSEGGYEYKLSLL